MVEEVGRQEEEQRQLGVGVHIAVVVVEEDSIVVAELEAAAVVVADERNLAEEGAGIQDEVPRHGEDILAVAVVRIGEAGCFEPNVPPPFDDELPLHASALHVPPSLVAVEHILVAVVAIPVAGVRILLAAYAFVPVVLAPAFRPTDVDAPVLPSFYVPVPSESFHLLHVFDVPLLAVRGPVRQFDDGARPLVTFAVLPLLLVVFSLRPPPEQPLLLDAFLPRRPLENGLLPAADVAVALHVVFVLPWQVVRILDAPFPRASVRLHVAVED